MILGARMEAVPGGVVESTIALAQKGSRRDHRTRLGIPEPRHELALADGGVFTIRRVK